MKLLQWILLLVPALPLMGASEPLRSSVPEPGMLVLVGSGLVALAMLGRKGRRKS